MSERVPLMRVEFTVAVQGPRGAPAPDAISAYLKAIETFETLPEGKRRDAPAPIEPVGQLPTPEEIYETRRMRTSDVMRGRQLVSAFMDREGRFIYLVSSTGEECEFPIHMVKRIERAKESPKPVAAQPKRVA